MSEHPEFLMFSSLFKNYKVYLKHCILRIISSNKCIQLKQVGEKKSLIYVTVLECKHQSVNTVFSDILTFFFFLQFLLLSVDGSETQAVLMFDSSLTIHIHIAVYLQISFALYLTDILASIS